MEGLFDRDKLFQFWPSSYQTYNERANASARFIIYASLIAYAIRRDNRIFGIAAFLLAAIYLFKKQNAPHKGVGRSEVESFFPETHWTNRQFHPMPDHHDLDGFLNFVYGGKRPNCRDDPTMCEPDDNLRMLEDSHRRAYSGGAAQRALHE